MKILTIEPSMVTLLGVASRRGGNWFSLDVFRDFIERYSFSAWPKTEEILENPAKLEFRLGRFNSLQIDRFTIYNDGIVVSAALDTVTLDDFIGDVLGYVAERWNIVLEKANSVDRMYQSVVSFSSEKDVLAPFSKAETLLSDVRAGVRDAIGFDVPFRCGGFVLAVDEASIASMKPTPFRIERRAGIEFQFNHFFSAAPLRTRDHIAILEKWEASV